MAAHSTNVLKKITFCNLNFIFVRSQMSFIVVVLQELITGKGAIEGVQEGNPVNIACLAVTVASILGLTAFLAMKGDDKYVDKALGRK